MAWPLNSYQFVRVLFKSQLSSTPPERWRAGKFQINLKSQYQMTKPILISEELMRKFFSIHLFLVASVLLHQHFVI
jgi:hypothetical protein